MSRKTENIFKSIEKLLELSKKLEDINKEFKSNEIDEVIFENNTNLKNLSFWIESLYSFNGKSRSSVKVRASRENGKKGGRPPKKISEIRERIRLLENSIIPELEEQKKKTIDFEQEEELSKKIQAFSQELNSLNAENLNYLKNRK